MAEEAKKEKAKALGIVQLAEIFNLRHL